MSMKDKTLKVAALGMRVHGDLAIAQLLAADGTALVAVAEDSEEWRQRVAARYGCAVYSDWRELIEKERPDVVTVCVPHYQKAEVVVECLDRGIHVLVDKPMATELEGLDAIEKAVNRGKAELQLLLTERFVPPFVALRRLIDEGQLGDIAGIVGLRPHEFDLGGQEPWMLHEEYEGGILVDLLIHDADLALWYTGEAYDYVLANQVQKAWKDHPGFWDIGHALFVTKSGTSVALEADWLTPRGTPWDCRLFVTGTEGAAEIQSLHFSRLSWWRHDGPRNHVEFKPIEYWPERQPEYEDSCGQDFIRRIRGEGKVILTAQEGIEANRAVLYARESARKKQLVYFP